MRLKDYGTKVTTLAVMGEDVDVYVTNQGKFLAADPNGDSDDDPLSGPTLDDLTKAIRKALTKKKAGVAVDVTILDYSPNERMNRWDRTTRGRSTFDCVLRGVHARTRAVMLRGPDGKLFQIDAWGGDRFIMTKRLTDAEKAVYRRGPGGPGRLAEGTPGRG